MNIKKIFNNKIFLIFLAPFFLGISLTLSFQPFNLTFVNFIILPLFFLIITYVSKRSKNIYRRKPYLQNLFFIGYMFGFGFFLSGIYWISYSLTFDEKFVYLIPISLVLMPMLLGLFFGIAIVSVGAFLKNNIASIFLFCCSLSFFDYMRSKILTGFPWNIWGYSWSWFTEMIQILNPIGLFAFNLLSLTLFCAPLLLVFKKKLSNLYILSIIILLSFSNYIYGSFMVNSSPKNTDQNSINIKLISPNFDLEYNLSSNQIEKKLQRLVKFSEPNKNKDTIFIWPEGVFTGYDLDELSAYKKIVENNFSRKHTILFGINTKNKKNGEIYNSLVAVNSSFEKIYQYNKKKLVPFGEFIPFEKQFNKLGLKKITEGHGSFARGAVQENLLINDLNILPLICYEIIFPEMIQKMNQDTNLIINVSEDAWFGKSIGPHQHFAKAIFRAVESNTILARSANQGITAFIDNRGKVIKRLEPYEAGNIELEILLNSSNYKNRNDLIFFVLLITYTIIFFTLRNKL